MARLLLFGKVGQLGWELRRTLAPLGEVVCLDYPEVDFTHPETLPGLIDQVAPQVIINAVAYTAVDKAESQVDMARLINATATGVLAEQALKRKAVLFHYSTDYVFDGRKGGAYLETDLTAPINVYGQTKLEGEQAVQQVGGAYAILRTSWVYSTRQGGFVTKVLQWARQQAVLRLVIDQVSKPTWARLLAEINAQLVAMAGEDPYGWFTQKAGLYHLAGGGVASRYDWAKAILANDPRPGEQIVRELQEALTVEFPTPAERPLYSVLDCGLFARTFGLALPDWKDSLSLAMES